MTKEQAILWVEDLRSGKYKQTTEGHLKDNIGHCCLGVLCERSKTAQFIKTQAPSGSHKIGRNGHSGTLPIEVMNEFGLSNPDGMKASDTSLFIEGAEYLSLSSANDKGVPFNKLADWIEENYMLL